MFHRNISTETTDGKIGLPNFRNSYYLKKSVKGAEISMPMIKLSYLNIK